MKKVLLNVTNHPSEQWSSEQKAEWDEIIDIPFPSVDPNLDTDDAEYQRVEVNLKKEIYRKNMYVIEEFGEDTRVYLCLQGEFSLCYRLFSELQLYHYFHFCIPTTQRIVEEKDGAKISKFKFVRWRYV